MKQIVIAIGREFGSGGLKVAEMVAEHCLLYTSISSCGNRSNQHWGTHSFGITGVSCKRK